MDKRHNCDVNTTTNLILPKRKEPLVTRGSFFISITLVIRCKQYKKHAIRSTTINPQEFDWEESQQVTVRNPTDKDFTFSVHNKAYMVGTHKRATIPGFVAWVYVYNMASKLCQDEEKFDSWNNEGFRAEYYDQIVVEIKPLVEVFDDEDDIQDVQDLSIGDDTPELAPGQGMNVPSKAKS